MGNVVIEDFNQREVSPIPRRFEIAKDEPLSQVVNRCIEEISEYGKATLEIKEDHILMVFQAKVCESPLNVIDRVMDTTKPTVKSVIDFFQNFFDDHNVEFNPEERRLAVIYAHFVKRYFGSFVTEQDYLDRSGHFKSVAVEQAILDDEYFNSPKTIEDIYPVGKALTLCDVHTLLRKNNIFSDTEISMCSLPITSLTDEGRIMSIMFNPSYQNWAEYIRGKNFTKGDYLVYVSTVCGAVINTCSNYPVTAAHSTTLKVLMRKLMVSVDLFFNQYDD